MESDFLTFLQAEQTLSFECGVPLARLTSFHIGGAAAAVVYPADILQLLLLLHAVQDFQVPFCILGGGTNILASDQGYDGAVIVTRHLRAVRRFGNLLVADCGAPLMQTAEEAARGCLSGMEPLYGIPGTVGGGVYMNAGAFQTEIKDILLYADIYDPDTGTVRRLLREDCHFAYRHSVFMEKGYVVLQAAFALQHGERAAIQARMAEVLARREQKQPLECSSAGSVFKRPVGDYASRLIDAAGLRGMSVGGAQVSEKHAGFIINRGGATAADVRALVDLVKEKVMATFGVLLEFEIRLL
ncbi:MAG: UDP-N-acetylmuramate dehydrogenase [Eubacteriales bacterium]